MGTPSPLLPSVVDPATSSSALLPPPPYTLVEYPANAGGPFFTQVDVHDDDGIRYMVRRHLIGQNHQLLEDLNFGDLFNRRDSTGDVTIICLEHPCKIPHPISLTDNCNHVSVKAHKFVLVRSSSFFQRYFESLHETPTTSCIFIPTIAASIMRLMLQLFYTGQVLMKFDEMTAFWGAAGNLQIRQVDPSYNWTYYIETLEPVSGTTEQSELSTNTVAFEAPYISTATIIPKQETGLQQGQLQGGNQEPQPVVTVASLVDTSSDPNTATSLHPVVILRPLGHSTLPLPNVTTAADAPIFYLTDQRTPPSPTAATDIIEHTISSGSTSTMTTNPTSPSLSSAEDLTMQMLAVNPDQRCRLYYPAASENDETTNGSESPAVTVNLPKPTPASTTSTPTTSARNIQSPRPRPRPTSSSSINNMVMCPICLIVVKQEKFAAHKKTCNVYGSPPTETNLFTCTLCGKSFATKHGLAAHKPFHTKKNNTTNNKSNGKGNNAKSPTKKSKSSPQKSTTPTTSEQSSSNSN